MYYHLISLTGEILQYQSNDLSDPNTSDFVVLGDMFYNQDEYYIFDGEFTLRPALPTFPTTGVAPLVLPLSSLAAGSSVTLHREYGDSLTITDLSEVWDLTDPGTYRIEILQPFPYRNLTQDIEVTDA